MIARIHKSEGKVILAVCDSELAGKYFEEGEMQLDVSSNFYKGEEMAEERIKELFKVVDIVNLVGENSVRLGVDSGLIENDKTIKISGIPHAECAIMRKD